MGRISNGWRPGDPILIRATSRGTSSSGPLGAVGGGGDCSGNRRRGPGSGFGEPVVGLRRLGSAGQRLPAHLTRLRRRRPCRRPFRPGRRRRRMIPDAVPEVDPHAGDADPDTDSADPDADSGRPSCRFGRPRTPNWLTRTRNGPIRTRSQPTRMRSRPTRTPSRRADPAVRGRVGRECRSFRGPGPLRAGRRRFRGRPRRAGASRRRG